MLNYFAYSLSGKLTDKSVDEIGGEFSQMLASPGIMTFWTFVVVLVSIGVCSLYKMALEELDLNLRINEMIRRTVR